MSSIREQIREGMATWPSLKQFVLMIVVGMMAAAIVGFTYGALQDGWHSHNPWIFIPAGIALGIGWLIVGILLLISEFSGGPATAQSEAPDKRNEKGASSKTQLHAVD